MKVHFSSDDLDDKIEKKEKIIFDFTPIIRILNPLDDVDRVL